MTQQTAKELPPPPPPPLPSPPLPSRFLYSPERFSSSWCCMLRMPLYLAKRWSVQVVVAAPAAVRIQACCGVQLRHAQMGRELRADIDPPGCKLYSCAFKLAARCAKDGGSLHALHKQSYWQNDC